MHLPIPITVPTFAWTAGQHSNEPKSNPISNKKSFEVIKAFFEVKLRTGRDSNPRPPP